MEPRNGYNVQQDKKSIGDEDGINIKPQAVKKQLEQFEKTRTAEIAQVKNKEEAAANRIKKKHN